VAGARRQIGFQQILVGIGNRGQPGADYGDDDDQDNGIQAGHRQLMLLQAPPGILPIGCVRADDGIAGTGADNGLE